MKKTEGANGAAIPRPPPHTGSDLRGVRASVFLCVRWEQNSNDFTRFPQGAVGCLGPTCLPPALCFAPHGRAGISGAGGGAGRQKEAISASPGLPLPSLCLVLPTTLPAALGGSGGGGLEDHADCVHRSSCKPTALPSLAHGRSLAHWWSKGCPKSQASPVLGLGDLQLKRLDTSVSSPIRAEREAIVQVGKPRPREVLPTVPKG